MPAPETKDLCSTDNLFALFDSAPQWKKAETEIKQACDRAAAEIKALQEKHRAAGALDTVSRTEIVAYISALIDGFPEPDSDHYKSRGSKEMRGVEPTKKYIITSRNWAKSRACQQSE